MAGGNFLQAGKVVLGKSAVGALFCGGSRQGAAAAQETVDEAMETRAVQGPSVAGYSTACPTGSTRQLCEATRHNHGVAGAPDGHCRAGKA